MADLIDPFPPLPFEIISLIIEQILEIEPKRALELICLSRNIQPVVERALYRCIIFHEASSLRFADMIKPRLRVRPNAFYQNCTKVLCMCWISFTDLITIFPVFSGVETLAIYYCYTGRRNITQLDINMLDAIGPRPTKLSCDWPWTYPPAESLNPDPFRLPMLFQNVTHLELNNQIWQHFNGKALHTLEHLTHLSLVSRMSGTYAIRSLAALLQTLFLADSIAVCIIFSPWLKDETGNYLESPEPRVVLATSADQDLHDERLDHVLRRRIANLAHFMRQWGERLDSKEMDMWEEAEQMVRAQRAKPVKANST
ncbi:hypothetical protein C8J56DRAFT_952561 [Mycena floridula]|nr:hypothetical protein C8J56DRAFT_952561 [Mycena floridula]